VILPTVTVEALFLSDGFFNYRSTDNEFGTEDAAAEFIALFGLEGQVGVRDLVEDFAGRQ
jgi:hypothetical protein